LRRIARKIHLASGKKSISSVASGANARPVRRETSRCEALPRAAERTVAGPRSKSVLTPSRRRRRSSGTLVTAGKAVAAQQVEHAPFHRAKGFSHDAAKILAGGDSGARPAVPCGAHHPPGTACIFS
jgi:hypothetical protein